MNDPEITPLMILQYLQSFKQSIEGRVEQGFREVKEKHMALEEKVDREFQIAREERIALHEDLVETMRIQGLHSVRMKKLGRLVGAK